MAAIFQIKRGTSNETLTDGELYLHKGIGSIQFGSGSSNVITLLPLNAPVNGNINLIGNISASGDVRIGGNIYLGDNLANDSVNVNSPFSGSLIPSGSNIFDLGSNTYKYKNVYATSISGAIAATNGVVSGSSQITYTGISSIPGGIVSGSVQVLGGTGIVSGSSQVTPLLPTGVVSGSSQITYASISSIPSGIVSGSAQVTPLLPTGVISGSSQIDATLTTNFATGVKTQLNTNTVVSGSSQITYANISSIPGGIVSGSAQVTPLLPTGVISGSSQLDNTTITNLTVTNLTTVNETASVLFSSGSNRFGDFGDDIHSFTGSVKISGSTIITGSVSATSFNGTINATNGVVSGSSQITYANVSSIPAGIVSGSSQVTPLLPTGVISGSSQIDATLTTNFATGVKTQLNTNTVVSGSSQITYTNISSIPSGIVSGSSQITYINISSIPGGIVSGSSQTIANLPTGTVSGSSQITYANISSIPGGIVSGSAQTIANLPTGTVSGSSQLTSSYDTRYSLSGSILTSFSASIDYRLDEVEYTASLFGGGITAQLDKINQATASLQLFSASAKISIANLETATSSYETKGSGIVSGSSQIVPLLPTGVVSGSIQILGGSGVWSGSAQLPSGVVSGSSQILGSSTIHSGSTNNYQFNSIGVGSTTVASGVDGEIRAQADITAFYSSDERLKENIQPIVDALSKVESISGNTYDWKAGFETIHSHTGHDIGVIAQEIEKVLPEVVINRETGYKAVQYEKIIPLLIEAIKELSAKVKELESK